MNKFKIIGNWIKARFDNVWVDKYPWYWHVIDLVIGIILGIAMAVTYEANTGVKVGLFFAITLLGYLLALAFTYGIVRAKNGWSKKRY